jgi:predicted acylesterase/phospholipase RssA
MVTAYVLSGGGSLGAVQTGMLQALTARGVEPDLLIGTSVGALNAAYVAGHGTGGASLDGLARIWSGMRRRDVFPQQRLILEVSHLADVVDIRVLPPLCPLTVSSTDFRHGAQLIGRARTATAHWLDTGGTQLTHPERYLSLHRHDLPQETASARGGAAA